MNTTIENHYLPPGSRLNEFEITEQLGEGGFSIVYLAWDHSLERQVALKEYMPSTVATRAQTSLVTVKSERHRETFDVGLRSFINEGKLLAQFDHPALVKVYRFWESNGTAYMAMPFYQGVTLKEMVRSLPKPPGEEWLIALLAPLTAALRVIHAKNCYHRDIAPDNVIILKENAQPLLLDFGAARRVIGDMTQSLTVILKPGYAPIEQYAEVPGLLQGPWTDVYALAATVYWAITGKPPPASVGRMVRDSCVPLVEAARGMYSETFLRAIDRALKILPDDRTPSIEAFRRELGIDPDPQPSSARSRWEDPDATVIGRRSAIEPVVAIPKLPERIDQPTSSDPRPSPPRASHEMPGLIHPSRSLWNWRTGLVAGTLAVLIAAGITAFNLTQNADHRPRPSDPAADHSVAMPQPTLPAAPAESPQPPLDAAPATAATAPQDASSSTPSSSTPSAEPPTASTGRDAPASSILAPEKGMRDTTVKTAKTERKKPAPNDSAECARLMAQLSLGDDNQAASARLRTLKCR